MSYEIRHEKGHIKPWRIIRKADGIDVGGSDTREKAERSMGYRNGGESPKPKTKGYENE